MGLAGHSYREILAFYYPGAELGSSGRGLRWQRLGGESITLLTTRPDVDGGVLSAAESALQAAVRRAMLTAPTGIELRVYPDLETFRNATGEPGWVAARTQGRRIHLQPAATLRSRGILEQTLRHEMLHVVVESHAAARVPLWFREGLAGYLEGAPAAGSDVRPPSDADLRQRDDPARARRAHIQSASAVAALVHRYGLPAVLDWLKNSSVSQAPWNSR
jgi:stage II sporulation protein D